MRAAAILVALVSCGGPEARSAGPTAGGSNQVDTSPATTGDAGPGHAPRVCLRDSKDPFPCVEECDRGIASSCATLAVRTELGEHVPKDITRAVMLYERACELKDVSSCVTAARLHASGRGVPPNRAKQVELLSHACSLGDGPSCSVPAKAFATGNGVPRDDRRANDLWQRGCSGGVETACDALGDAGH